MAGALQQMAVVSPVAAAVTADAFVVGLVQMPRIPLGDAQLAMEAVGAPGQGQRPSNKKCLAQCLTLMPLHVLITGRGPAPTIHGRAPCPLPLNDTWPPPFGPFSPRTPGQAPASR